MQKILRTSAIILISFILLLVAILTVVVNVIDPNAYKKPITEAVQKATGRTLTIGGKIEWSLFPWLSLNLHELSFSNAPGFGETPFLSVKTANASIKLLPLLVKKLEVRTLSLDNAHIQLARSSGGINNWDDLIKAPKSQAPTNTAASSSVTHTKENFAISIDNIHISHSTVNWDNLQSAQSLEISNLDFAVHQFQFDHFFKVRLKAHLLDPTKNIALEINFSGNLKLGSDLNTFTAEKVLAEINNFILKGHISAEDIHQHLNFKGAITIPNFDLKAFLLSLKQNLPATQNTNSLKNFSLETQFEGSAESLRLAALTLQLDNTHLAGQASLQHFAAPIVRFAITGDTLNIDDYKFLPQANAPQAAPLIGSPANKNSSTIQPVSETQNAYTTIRKLDLEGQLYIATLQVMHLTSTDLSVSVKANNGLIQLQNLQAKMYEGSLLSELTYDVRTNTPKINFKGKASDVELQPLLKDFINKDIFSGKAHVTLDLNSNGSSTALLRNLNGNLAFGLDNGQLDTLDLAYPIEQLKALLNNQPAPPESAITITHFDKLSATARIVNGVINNNDFILESNNLLSAKGLGTIDLPNQTINYMLRVKPLNAGDLNGYEIPIDIKGNLAAPQVTPDLTSIVKQVAVQTVSQQVGQQINQQVQELAKQIKW